MFFHGHHPHSSTCFTAFALLKLKIVWLYNNRIKKKNEGGTIPTAPFIFIWSGSIAGYWVLLKKKNTSALMKLVPINLTSPHWKKDYVWFTCFCISSMIFCVSIFRNSVVDDWITVQSHREFVCVIDSRWFRFASISPHSHRMDKKTIVVVLYPHTFLPGMDSIALCWPYKYMTLRCIIELSMLWSMHTGLHRYSSLIVCVYRLHTCEMGNNQYKRYTHTQRGPMNKHRKSDELLYKILTVGVIIEKDLIVMKSKDIYLIRHKKKPNQMKWKKKRLGN